MLYLSIIVASILSGMGIGGGGVVIILLSNFNILNHKEAMLVSVIMFIASGISASFFNLKNEKVDKNKLKNYFLKLIFFVIIGSIIGSKFVKYIVVDKLKIYFNLFMLIIGIYEIISSLKIIKKEKI